MYIKQCKNWETYFNSIGWNSFRLSNGILVVFRRTPFGIFAKIQRPPPLNEFLLKELDDYCNKLKIAFVKLESSLEQPLNVIKNQGFRVSNCPLLPPSTMCIDLTVSEKMLWSKLTTSGKYGINRGIKEDAKVIFLQDPSIKDLEGYFNSIQNYTSRDKGFRSLTLNELCLAKKAFGKDTYLSLDYDGKGNLAGGKFYLLHEDTVFYLTGGTTESGKHTRVGFVQMWESIKFFKQLGYKNLDLDGMYDKRFHNFTKSWIGFSDFKKKFGGSIVEYPLPYNKYYSKILKFFVGIKFLRLDF